MSAENPGAWAFPADAREEKIKFVTYTSIHNIVSSGCRPSEVATSQVSVFGDNCLDLSLAFNIQIIYLHSCTVIILPPNPPDKSYFFAHDWAQNERENEEKLPATGQLTVKSTEGPFYSGVL
jgi:hypothetical protein